MVVCFLGGVCWGRLCLGFGGVCFGAFSFLVVFARRLLCCLVVFFSWRCWCVPFLFFLLEKVKTKRGKAQKAGQEQWRPLTGNAATPCYVSVGVDQVEQVLNAAAGVASYLTGNAATPCMRLRGRGPSGAGVERGCRSGVLFDRQCCHAVHASPWSWTKWSRCKARLPEWRPI